MNSPSPRHWVPWTNDPPNESGIYLYWGGGTRAQLIDVYGRYYRIGGTEILIDSWSEYEWRSQRPVRKPPKAVS